MRICSNHEKRTPRHPAAGLSPLNVLGEPGHLDNTIRSSEGAAVICDQLATAGPHSLACLLPSPAGVVKRHPELGVHIAAPTDVTEIGVPPAERSSPSSMGGTRATWSALKRGGGASRG